jgi:phage-related protein
MAVIGHAEIVVRAITNNFEKELKDTLKNVSKSISVGAGRRIGDGFADGFNRSRASGMFGKIADGLRSMVPEAEAARERFQSLVRTGFVLQGVLGAIVGAISSVVVSIGPLVGSLLKAASSAGILLNAFVALRVAIAVGRTAFGNIFQAVQQATQVNGGYAKSLKDIREEWQQLLFDAEAASYSEEEAALNLEKAFNNLRRMADLPPNSMARREAELEYRQADLAYRRAKDRTQDLNETVQEGFDAFKDAQRTAGGAGADPLSQLNEAQRKFAERLIQLNPKLDRLKLKMSDAFLTPLYETVDVFEKRLLPILDKRLPEIAGQAGEAINQVFTGLNFDRINTILSEMTTPFEEGGRSNLQLFGDILGQILDLFLKILDATGKPLNDLLTSIKNTFGDFVANADTNKMETFFTNALEEAKKWVPIISNIFGGLKTLMDLTTGPGSAGEYMLEWFTEATAAFKNMFAEDPEAGKTFFKDAMVNARSVLSSIGAFIKAILGVADNPAIKETFDRLKEGAPGFERFLDEIIEAGPSFADLLINVGRIITALTDSEQLSAFFDTLSVAAGKFADALESEGVQGFLDRVGPLFGALSAIGVVIDAITFGFQVLVGYAALFYLNTQKAFDFLKLTPANISKAFGILGNVLKGAGVLGVILFIVSKIDEFYNKFSDFRGMVDRVFANIAEAFGELWAQLSELFENLFGGNGIGGIIEALDPVIKFILEFLIPIAGYIVERFINAFTFIVSVINTIVSPIMQIIKGLVEGIVLLFTDFPTGVKKIAATVVTIFVGIGEIIVNFFVDIINWILGGIENLVRAIGNTPLGKVIKDLTGINLAAAKLIRLEKVQWVRDAIANTNSKLGLNKQSANVTNRNRADGTPKLAMGGTIYPSRGGTLVTVAEAGRPERIEPLNPNGLSDRDIALINQMGGGPKVSITVNPAPGMDEKELAAAVSRRLAFEIRKGTI